MADYFIDGTGLRRLLTQGSLPSSPLLEVAKAKLLGVRPGCKACGRSKPSTVAVDTLMASALDNMARTSSDKLRRSILSAEGQPMDRTVEMALAGRSIRLHFVRSA